jgi:hypothetical protein
MARPWRTDQPTPVIDRLAGAVPAADHIANLFIRSVSFSNLESGPITFLEAGSRHAAIIHDAAR